MKQFPDTARFGKFLYGALASQWSAAGQARSAKFYRSLIPPQHTEP